MAFDAAGRPDPYERGAVRRHAKKRGPQSATGVHFERRVVLLGVLLGAPGLVLAAFALHKPATPPWSWALLAVAVLVWAASIRALHAQAVRPLQTLANVVAALREEDFSFRALVGPPGDALSELAAEVNALASMLQEQRLAAVEASALLRKVMGEIEVAVFALDARDRLQLVNRAGEDLLARPAERMLGRTAEELGLADFLRDSPAGVLPHAFPGRSGRWMVRRTTFRQHGEVHRLLLLSDVSRALREEERQAWQRLIRVFGHELNNSLAPIKSIAGTLLQMTRRAVQPPAHAADLERGLEVIETRSDALNRFLQSYATLARLPEPSLQPVALRPLVERTAAVQRRAFVRVEPGPAVELAADPDQLEQMLINLLKNAVEATLEAAADAPERLAAGVTIRWSARDGAVEITVDDHGPGLLNSANLFVPFYTTKPAGSGIGLVLCRQIAEAHGGTLTLTNRPDGSGCRASVRLPLAT